MRITVQRLLLVAAVALGSAIARPARCGPVAGLRGGLSAARLYGNDAISKGAHLGGGGGWFVSFPLGGPFSIQPELLYVMKGTSLGRVEGIRKAGNIVYGGEGFVHLDYLELPVLLRVGIPAGGAVRPFVIAGPAPAFELSERVEGDYGDGTRYEVDLDALKDLDLGAILGLGLEVEHWQTRWLFEARYDFGVLDLERPTVGDGGIRNGAFLLSLGLGWVVGE